MIHKKTSIYVLLSAIVVLTSLAFILLRGTSESSSTIQTKTENSRRLLKSRRNIHNRSPQEAVRESMKGVKSKKNTKSERVNRPSEDWFSHLKGEDRELAKSVQDALDGGNLKKVLIAAEKALKSNNAEVRLNTVESLGWFGSVALPELTGAMSDPDEDVANAAESAWEIGLDQIEDVDKKFSIAAAAMSTLSNPDHLTTISGQLTAAALEFIDSAETETESNENRVLVVQALVDIMDSKYDAGVAQAQEAYEDITGNKWISIEEAELYLNDPKNYEPPEDSGE